MPFRRKIRRENKRKILLEKRGDHQERGEEK